MLDDKIDKRMKKREKKLKDSIESFFHSSRSMIEKWKKQMIKRMDNCKTIEQIQMKMSEMIESDYDLENKQQRIKEWVDNSNVF